MASRAQRGRYMSRGFLNLRIYRGPSVWLVYILGKKMFAAQALGRADYWLAVQGARRVSIYFVSERYAHIAAYDSVTS